MWRQARPAPPSTRMCCPRGTPTGGWRIAPALQTVSGPAGFSLAWRPSNPAQPGLPAGWNLDPSGSVSSWRSLVVNSDASVTLSGDAGPSITFEQVSPGDYRPVFGADQTWPPGEYSTLVHNANGTWSVTDLNSTVTEFSATSSVVKTAWPERVWVGRGPAPGPELRRHRTSGRPDRPGVGGQHHLLLRTRWLYPPQRRALPAPRWHALRRHRMGRHQDGPVLCDYSRRRDPGRPDHRLLWLGHDRPAGRLRLGQPRPGRLAAPAPG